MNYRTKQALCELGCRIFGHRWRLFSVEVFTDLKDIEVTLAGFNVHAAEQASATGFVVPPELAARILAGQTEDLPDAVFVSPEGIVSMPLIAARSKRER